MQSKGFPWWGWLMIAASVSAGALNLNWFAQAGWVTVSSAASGIIEFVEQSSRPQPQLPVGDQDR